MSTNRSALPLRRWLKRTVNGRGSRSLNAPAAYGDLHSGGALTVGVNCSRAPVVATSTGKSPADGKGFAGRRLVLMLIVACSQNMH